jgi:hypothetical protein
LFDSAPPRLRQARDLRARRPERVDTSSLVSAMREGRTGQSGVRGIAVPKWQQYTEHMSAKSGADLCTTCRLNSLWHRCSSTKRPSDRHSIPNVGVGPYVKEVLTARPPVQRQRLHSPRCPRANPNYCLTCPLEGPLQLGLVLTYSDSRNASRNGLAALTALMYCAKKKRLLEHAPIAVIRSLSDKMCASATTHRSKVRPVKNTLCKSLRLAELEGGNCWSIRR